jgi:nucleotide-binding universal stress UspA family protein
MGAWGVAYFFPPCKVPGDAATGSAYAAIVDRAKRWDADLILVGSHGRSFFGRVVFGSVAQSVLSHSPCSVRVGRGQAPGSDKPIAFPLRVMIGVDGSADSSAAVESVCSREWPPGTEVRLVTVSDLRLVLALLDAGTMPDEAEVTHACDSPIEKIASAAGKQFCNKPGLKVSTVVLEGDPKQAILREAERWGADCVVLGVKGHSRLERFLLGSVSASVAARAGCTVEVIRKPPGVASR